MVYNILSATQQIINDNVHPIVRMNKSVVTFIRSTDKWWDSKNQHFAISLRKEISVIKFSNKV